MEFSKKMENELKNIFKKYDIKLPTGGNYLESLVDLNYYKQHNWSLVLHFDYLFSCFHIGLFSEALEKMNIKDIEIFLMYENNFKYYKTIEPKYIDIKGYFDDLSIDYELIGAPILIINKELDFLVYINDTKEQFYFYGNKKFINLIMPVSNEVKKEYFESYYEIYDDELWRVYFLKWLYKNYLEF